MDGGAFSVEVEAKGIERQLLEAESAEAFDSDANHGGRVGGHAGRRETIHGGTEAPVTRSGQRVTG